MSRFLHRTLRDVCLCVIVCMPSVSPLFTLARAYGIEYRLALSKSSNRNKEAAVEAMRTAQHRCVLLSAIWLYISVIPLFIFCLSELSSFSSSQRTSLSVSSDPSLYLQSFFHACLGCKRSLNLLLTFLRTHVFSVYQ